MIAYVLLLLALSHSQKIISAKDVKYELLSPIKQKVFIQPLQYEKVFTSEFEIINMRIDYSDEKDIDKCKFVNFPFSTVYAH